MKCIICGKELTGKRKKYCSMKCAQKGFILGKSTHFKDDSKKVLSLYKRFSISFLPMKLSNNTSPSLRFG